MMMPVGRRKMDNNAHEYVFYCNVLMIYLILPYTLYAIFPSTCQAGDCYHYEDGK